MLLPTFKRLTKQDYKEDDRDLVDRLSVSLNIGIETLYQLANKRISLTDNIAAVVKSFEIRVNAQGTPISGVTNVSVGTTLTSIVGTTILRAQNTENSSIYPTGSPFISFTQNGNSIDINNVAGLPANNTFLLTIVIWG